MDPINIIFGGLGGAVLTAAVMLYVEWRRQPRPMGKASHVLKGLGKILHQARGWYYFSDSGDANFRIASHLYGEADGQVIGTAFHENPAEYGDRDLVRNFSRGGSLFTRISCAEACSAESEKIARETLASIQRGAELVVVPSGQLFTRMDGIFCRFSDDTYLCFVSFRDPAQPGSNRGAVFTGKLAAAFFDYYATLAKRYARQSS